MKKDSPQNVRGVDSALISHIHSHAVVRGPKHELISKSPNQPLITPFAAIAEGKITSSIVGVRVDCLPAGARRFKEAL